MASRFASGDAPEPDLPPPAAPLLTRAQVEAAVGRASTIAQAHRAWSAGEVDLIIAHATNGGVVLAGLTGPPDAAHEARLLVRAPPYPRLKVSCTCGASGARLCAHAAAVALQWLSDSEAGATAPASTDAAASSPPPPPHEVAFWLAAIEEAAARAEGAYPATVRDRLFYLIEPMPAYGLALSPVRVRLDKNGRPSGARQRYTSYHSATPAKFLRASDLAILAQTRGGALRAEDGALLDAVIATGRAHWESLDSPALSHGSPRRAIGDWSFTANGDQKFSLTFEDVPPDAAPLTLLFDPPRWLDLGSGKIGPIEVAGVDAGTLLRLLNAPPIAPDHAELVGKRLGAMLGPATPRPRPPPPRRKATLHPIPCLTLERFETHERDWATGRPRTVVFGFARLAFAYGPAQTAPDARGELRALIDGELVTFERQPAREAALTKELTEAGLARLDKIGRASPYSALATAYGFSAASETQGWRTFMARTRAQLEARGWRIAVASDFPEQVTTVDAGDLTLALAPEPSGLDWFSLAIPATVDGQAVDLVGPILALIRKLPQDADLRTADGVLTALGGPDGQVFAPLGDGRTLALEAARAAPIMRALLAIWGPGADAAEREPWRRVQRYDALALASAAAAGTVQAQGRLAGLVAAFRDWRLGERPTPPAWFKAALRPYQAEGAAWLQMLARAGFGGLLADDMGLGKTVQTLAHLAIEKEAGRLKAPTLIVAPTSVLETWRAQAETFAPALSTAVLRGGDRKAKLDQVEADLLVTSYPLLQRDAEALALRRFSVIVFDEAQTLRNPAARTTKAAFGLKADQIIALTGTPVENGLVDLWSIMHALNPGLLGGPQDFAKSYRRPIEKEGCAAAGARLARRVAPFVLRRTKAQVAKELPAKTAIDERVALTDGQRRLYEATRLAMEKRVRTALAERGLAKSRIIVLDALLKLRQICCDPRLLPHAPAGADAAGSAKLERLIELIDALHAEGRQALVFSQFTSMLSLIRAEVEARAIPYAWLTGDTIDRKAPLQAFQSGHARLFLASLKAGGTGLTLTAADTVILYDPWWNPAAEAQAIDRAHRIGQTKPVFVHRLIVADTVETKILDLQARKQALADALFDENAKGLADLTEDDVAALFA